VKKAYKRLALKYHPDKNRDCDSSCIFAAIQSSYEILLASAPPEHNDSSFTNAEEEIARDKQSRMSTNATNTKASGSNTSAHSQGSNVPKSNNNQPQRAARAPHATFSEASQVSGMSTEELRRALQKVGVSNLNICFILNLL
jgi:DnaJ-class molecular chaperone